jgi:glycosyltransferase involved in cell wall biosynthesis
MGGRAARQAGARLVFHTRDFLPAGIWRRALIGLAYRQSDRIIVNSKSVAQVYGKDPLGKVSVVYNYVEPPKIQAGKTPVNVRAENGCPANAPLIGYSGRLHPAKGLETLFIGFSRILKVLPDARLWIVGGAMPGEEHYPESLKTTARKIGIAGSVKFFGWRDDALEIMSCFDVLAVPSQKEPFGRVTVEAMMLGIPVAATASGGTLEIIENNETGLLFDPGDSRQLADKCLEIITDPEKTDRMTRLAKSKVELKFSAENYIGGVQRVYDSVVGK